jgi:hypothetical protein
MLSRSWSSLSLSLSLSSVRGLLVLAAALALFFTMCLDISLNSAATEQPGRRWRSGRDARDNVEIEPRLKQRVDVDKTFANVINQNKKRKPLVHVDKSRGVNVTRTDEAGQGESPVRVPSLVHVIWFYPPNTTFRFHQLLSLLSVQQHVAPTSLMFWHSPAAPPVGAWWRFAKETLAGSLYLVERPPPQHVFGRAVKRPEHQADVARIDILLQHGGIYIDLDVIVVKSLRPLLRYPVSMGAESPHLLGSGVIVAEKNASFLALWRQHYASFDDTQWNQHSVVLPMLLASQHPHLIHIEWFSLHRPNWDERQWLYAAGKLWAWQQDNLAVHLWYREYHTEHDPHSIRTWNTTAGEIFRYIYYGSPDLLEP